MSSQGSDHGTTGAGSLSNFVGGKHVGTQDGRTYHARRPQHR